MTADDISGPDHSQTDTTRMPGVVGSSRLASYMAWSARQTFHRTRTGKMEEAICAENNFAFAEDAAVSEIPKAERPDF